MDKLNLIKSNQLKNINSKPKLLQRNLSELGNDDIKSLSDNNQQIKPSIIDYSKGTIVRNQNLKLNPISEVNHFDLKKIETSHIEKNTNINNSKFILPENDSKKLLNTDLLGKEIKIKAKENEYLIKELIPINGKIVSNKGDQNDNNILSPNSINSKIKDGNYPNNERAGMVVSQKLN